MASSRGSITRKITRSNCGSQKTLRHRATRTSGVLIPPNAFQRPDEHCPSPQGMSVFWKSHFAPALERAMLGQKLPQNAVITRRVYEIEPIVIASRDEV